MLNSALSGVNSRKRPLRPQSRDTIQVMRDGFPAEKLQELLSCLEGDGHACTVFTGLNGIRAALRDPRTKLLLVGISSERLPEVTAAVRGAATSTQDIPVIAYLTGVGRGRAHELPIDEVDDFLLEPLNIQDLRLRILRLGQRFLSLQDEAERVRQSLLSDNGMRLFIGKAPAFLAAVEKIPRVASCDAAVLMLGDTGTGKEMCARAIHYFSPRADKPFIPINCGSIPGELFENEMFGHAPGAFTDARREWGGLITEAEGGTLFLDEIDSLAPSSQVKLLRFLQDKQFRPLGSSRYRRADVRLLAASNQNLEKKVQEGAFRQDLYYRLNVVLLRLPSLRERPEDIMLLARHFLQTAAEEYKSPVTRFSPDAVRKLMSYAWPGNVRELENVVRNAVIFAEGTVIRTHNLTLPAGQHPAQKVEKESFKIAKARVIEEFERNYLKEVVDACGGNISQAARRAQKDRRSFFALLKKYHYTSGFQHFESKKQTDDPLGAADQS